MATANTKRDEKKNSADLYSTPKEALDAIKELLIRDVHTQYKDEVYILEPCAGVGAISDWLIDNMVNFNVSLHDNELHNYGYKAVYREDFLADVNVIGEYDIIVTNPPYNKAVDFVLKGFEHAPVQWHFLRLSFLEGQERYEKLMSLGKLTDVYIFTYRVSCTKGVDREPSANSVCYAWYRFDRNYNGLPTLHWLTK